MARASVRRVVLAVVASDDTFDRVELRGATVWRGKCIHCGSALVVSEAGEPLGQATLEHIVPRAHGGTDDVANLALACARCNHAKGRRQDARGPRDPGYQAMVERLLARKAARRREPCM